MASEPCPNIRGVRPFADAVRPLTQQKHLLFSPGIDFVQPTNDIPMCYLGLLQRSSKACSKTSFVFFLSS